MHLYVDDSAIVDRVACASGSVNALKPMNDGALRRALPKLLALFNPICTQRTLPTDFLTKLEYRERSF